MKYYGLVGTNEVTQLADDEDAPAGTIPMAANRSNEADLAQANGTWLFDQPTADALATARAAAT